MIEQPPVLLLFPESFQPRPDADVVECALADLGMTGPPLGEAGYYLVGDRFIDHVSFLGCSPDIRLEPHADERPGEAGFLHVSLKNLAGELSHRHGRHPRPPLCPECRKPAPGVDDISSPYRCRHCGAAVPPLDLVWRDGEVVLQDAIEFIGVHPREGVPTEHFLAELARSTNCRWRYLYL